MHLKTISIHVFVNKTQVICCHPKLKLGADGITYVIFDTKVALERVFKLGNVQNRKI